MTKQKEAPKSKKSINFKQVFAGLYSLVIALAELASVYIFATQDNPILYPVAAVLGLDAAVRLTTKFVK